MKCLIPKKKELSITCDTCHREFKLKKLTKRKVAPDVTKYVLVCPHCKSEFRVFYENADSARIGKILNKSRVLSVEERKQYMVELHKIEKELETRFESGQKA